MFSYRTLGMIVAAGGALCAVLVWWTFSASQSFTAPVTVRIVDGASGVAIARQLRDAHIVRSDMVLRAVYAYAYPGEHIRAGTYRFDPAQGRDVFAVARGLHGDALVPPLRITIPEGSTGSDILRIFKTAFADTARLDGLTAKEIDTQIGYLFPDTYEVSDDMDARAVLVRMHERYETVITPLRGDIAASGMSEKEIIILASLIEREANTEDSMRHVSGILQNRLAQGMRLQADATLDYILGKSSSELTEADLAIDSPYNTYRHDGLPPTPIANPGLQAIKAALHPIVSDDLYYLTAPDGTFYYAKTFEEHKANKAKYLH